MALIVEDGTGRSDAESYVAVADADTYHSNRGNTAWAALQTSAKEQLLRQAADYMQQSYRLRWQGSRNSSVQKLDWPRAWVPIPDAPSGYYAYPTYLATNVIPSEVKDACSELALTAISGALSPDIERTQNRVKVGSIEVEYDPNAQEYTRFRKVDNLLAPYLNGSSVMRKLVRT